MAAKKKSEIAQRTWKASADVKREIEQIVNFQFGPDENRILLRVARRLLVGKERYGFMRLRQDKRNYAKEASEELLDWLVYTEMELERAAQRKRRPGKVRPKAA